MALTSLSWRGERISSINEAWRSVFLLYAEAPVPTTVALLAVELPTYSPAS